MSVKVGGPRLRGILFSAPMVAALLAGKKTQTRRLIKNVPAVMLEGRAVPELVEEYQKAWLATCPYGQPGDRLYVKEACWMWGRWERDGLTKTGRQKWRFKAVGKRVTFEKPERTAKRDGSTGWVYRHARYVPRRASRITLEVTSIRVERLQAITEEDAKAEGVEPFYCGRIKYAHVGCCGHKPRFATLWDAINGKRSSWASNPFCWVVEFRRVA